jgi:hypothetical protein
MERNVWRKSTRSGNNGQCVEVCDRAFWSMYVTPSSLRTPC